MAATKSALTVLTSQSIAAGGTKASPAITVPSLDYTTYSYPALLTLSVANGASAPGAALQLQVQTSGDGTNWRDYGAPMAGDTTASSSYSWSFEMSRSTMYVRVVPYGNTTNAVTASAEMQVLVTP
jgi:hypothetical protein